MNQYLVYHRHAPGDCAASFAAWNGFHSVLRQSQARSTCAFGGHEIWWTVNAGCEGDAAALLPKFVADRSVIVRCAQVAIP